MTIVYLDSHKPFSVAGTLKAKKERVGEEGAGASRGPKKKKKRFWGPLKGDWVIICRILLLEMWLLDPSISIIRVNVSTNISKCSMSPIIKEVGNDRGNNGNNFS